MLRSRHHRRSAMLVAVVAACATPLWSLASVPAYADSSDQTLIVEVDRDVDGNGSYDPDVDRPQPGIALVISDAAGHHVEGTTDDDGDYELSASDALEGGRYFVVAEIPDSQSDLMPVTDSESFAPFSTSVDVSTEKQRVRMGVVTRTEPTEEPSSAAPTESTAPETPAATFAVGDLVWRDDNRSGRQDPGEPGQPKVSVQLLDGDGDVLDSTVSDASGHFLFDRLRAGTYALRFAGLPNGFRLTTRGAGSDPQDDSDPEPNGATPPFTLAEGAAGVRAASDPDHVAANHVALGLDAGIVALRYAIGDRVWLDANADGVQQADEPPAAATVTLFRDESVVATTSTDAAGRYLLTNLARGRYRVQFNHLGPHRSLTIARGTSDAGADSDADPGTGLTRVISLAPGAPHLVPATTGSADFLNPTVNAGVVGSYSVGDSVFDDRDGDGVVDPGEPGVAGVKVDLLDAAKQVVASRRTSASGHFGFEGLRAGSYALRFALPSGKVFTRTHIGTNPAVDSDADTSGLTAAFALGDNDPADTSIDAGVTTPEVYRASAASGTGAAAAVGVVALSDTGGVDAGIPLTGVLLMVLGAAGIVVGQILGRGPSVDLGSAWSAAAGRLSGWVRRPRRHPRA